MQDILRKNAILITSQISTQRCHTLFSFNPHQEPITRSLHSHTNPMRQALPLIILFLETTRLLDTHCPTLLLQQYSSLPYYCYLFILPSLRGLINVRQAFPTFSCGSHPTPPDYFLYPILCMVKLRENTRRSRVFLPTS